VKSLSIVSIAFLSLFVPTIAYNCPICYPVYYSMKESKLPQPFLAGTPDDWSPYLPGNNLESFYASYFMRFTGDRQNALSLFRKAQALEDAGDYQAASRLFKEIDKTRRSVWDWTGLRQIPIRYQISDEEEQTETSSASDDPKPAFEIHNIPLPPTSAWFWKRPKTPESEDYVLCYQEAAHRAGFYSEAAFKHPETLAVYLKARKAFLAGDTPTCQGLLSSLSTTSTSLQSAAQELVFLCRLKAAAHPSEIQEEIDRQVALGSPRVLLNIASSYLRDLDAPGSTEQAEKVLSQILLKHPKSRYADDACFLLAKLFILRKDAAKASSAFIKLGTVYNDDDVVPFGGLASLASFAKTHLATPSLEDAFWRLAKGPGVYDPVKSQVESLDVVFQPYLLLWRSEKETTDKKRRALLERIVAGKPDGCIHREALYLLTVKENLSNRALAWSGPKNPIFQTNRVLEFLETYPEDPRASFLLERSWRYLPDNTPTNRRLASIHRAMSNFHDFPNLKLLGKRRNQVIPPFGDQDRLNIRFLLDSERCLTLVNSYPKSPWAFPCLLRSTVGNSPSPSTLLSLRRYIAWSQGRPDFERERRDILQVKLAGLEMLNHQWADALKDVEKCLATQGAIPLLDEALWIKANCLEKLGRNGKADRVYDQIVDLFPEGANAADYSWEASLDSMDDYAYGQMPEKKKRSPTSSPYTLEAYEKITRRLEKNGEREKALDIYLRLGYRRDIALLLDFEMTPSEIENYLQEHPDHPKTDLLRYSLSMNHFRRNDFSAALRALDESTEPVLITSKGSELDVDPKDIPSLIQAIRLTRSYYDAVTTAPTDEARSLAIYELGRFHYHRGRALYYNSKLWEDLWFNRSEAPLMKEAPTDDSHHQPLTHFRDAGIHFHQVVKNHPQSSIRDRALYSYALCIMRSFISDKPFIAPEDKGKDSSDIFQLLAREYPQSPLADDALFWGGSPLDLSKTHPEGDLVRFLTPQDLKKGDYWRDAFEGFRQHNRFLRSPMEARFDPVLNNSLYLADPETGKPFDGWLYYLSPGSSAPFKGFFHMDFAGLDDTAIEVNLSGKVARLPAGQNKSFVLEDPSWAPNVTKWVYFKVDAIPDHFAQATHFLEVQNEIGRYTTSTHTVDLFNSIQPMRQSHATYPLPDLQGLHTYSCRCATDGKTLWNIDRGENNPRLLVLCDPTGKPVRSSAVTAYDAISSPDRDTYWSEDDSVLFFPDRSFTFENGRAIFHWLWGPQGDIQNYFPKDNPNLARIGYENLRYENGGVIDDEHHVLMTLPKPLPPKAIVNHTDVHGEPERVPGAKHVWMNINKANSLGFETDRIKIRVQNADNFKSICLGQDVDHRIYLVDTGYRGDREQWVYVLNPQGTVLYRSSFPPVPRDESLYFNWPYERFAFTVLPEGGLLRIYPTLQPQSMLVVDKLSF